MVDASPTRLRSIAPATLVGSLAVVEVLLYASDRFDWFAYNRYEGYTSVVAVLMIGVWLLFCSAWVASSWLWKRPIQFGLGWLLATIPVVALPCAWLAAHIQQARRETQIVAAIESTGGKIQRHEFVFGPTQVDKLMMNVFGLDFVLPVGDVQLASKGNLHQLKWLRHVKSLNLDDLPVTDADLAVVAELRELDFLYLRRTSISDEGLKKLSALPRLGSLYLDGTPITDEGMKHVREMVLLQDLGLSQTQVTDVGLSQLKDCKELWLLQLNGTTITDLGLEKIAQFKDLWELEVRNTQVTDEGVLKLQKALPRLQITHR